ncbi:MAG: Ig-like domain-containing protein, partial [Nocardioides sp.]
MAFSAGCVDRPGSTRLAAALATIVVAALLMAVPAGSAAVGAVALPSTAPASASVPREACTVVGTSGRDVLRGTPGPDVICGRGGKDRLLGRGGDDIVRGGSGADTVIGGGGDDLLIGGYGNDRLLGRDATRSRDRLRCGPGRGDRATADTGDRVYRSCEVIRQNDAPTDVTLAPSEIAENEPAGSVVGTLGAVDPDRLDVHRFALASGTGDRDNETFAVAGTELVTAAVLDFEEAEQLSVRVRATDREGATYERVLVVSVLDVAENGSPLAVDDRFAVDEDSTLELPVSGAGSPAANDTDPDGDSLTVVGVEASRGGTVELVDDQIRFVVDRDLCGTGAAAFGYTVADGRGGSADGVVVVDVGCLPDPPIASDDTAVVSEDAGAVPLGVLGNDRDADGDSLVIESVTQPGDGTVVITGGGSGVTYAPDADYCNDPPGTALDTFT